MKFAYVHFAEGFEEIEAITVVDVLRRAEIPVRMVSITGKLPVTGAHGITIHADQLFEETEYSEASMLILPGGLPGATNLNSHTGLKKKLLDFNEKNEKLAAICAAPLVLGGLQILEGKEATCYPGYESKLLGARLSSRQTVKSENVITSRGAGTALNFALEIVSELKGKTLADKIAKAMIVQPC
jgi:4-methyl-5(b-hydroxyethyl)-thiazole monophosphate biosynthesis